MKIFNGVADLQEAVGTHLGFSDWHVVTQDQIDSFAETTGDRQWIHVDTERAAAGPFGATIAHGFLTLSLVPQLVWQVYEIQGIKMGVNYGADRLRFPSPVPADSKVRAGVELKAVTEIPMGFQVATTVTIECDGTVKPACVVDMLAVVVP